MCGQPPSHDQTSGFYPHLTVICLHPNIKHPQVTFKIPLFILYTFKKQDISLVASGTQTLNLPKYGKPRAESLFLS